ncbi:hypothetical protein KBD81_02985 [Candidatus Woesebacteria bacterium]|nr:hypothetical protein [Candidatus Woesebacteria bacterium]
MSRIYAQKKRQNNQKIMGLILIVIALTIFMVTIGFQLLINSVVFINTLFNPQTEESSNTKSQDFFGTITLDEPPSATNSAQIMISGSAQDFDTVEIILNDTRVLSIPQVDASFEDRIGILEEGENTIYALAKTKDGKHVKESDTYTVIFKSEAFAMEIETPTQDMTTRTQDLVVKGTIDPGSTLKINNQPVVIHAQGSFETTYRLKEGDNTLLFHGEDIAGNTKDIEIKVKYEKEE